MIKAVIFDMGGVLLRTGDRAPREALAAKFGMTYEEIDALVFDAPTAQQAAVGAISEREHWASIGKHLNLTPEELQKFEEQFWAGDAVDKDLLGFIDSLRPAYRTGLLSNAWADARESVTRRYQLLEPFDVVVFSAEAKLAKPDSAVYRLILKELSVEPEEAVFVDDVLKNIEAARALGMKGIVFQTPQQTQKELLSLLNHHS